MLSIFYVYLSMNCWVVNLNYFMIMWKKIIVFQYIFAACKYTCILRAWRTVIVIVELTRTALRYHISFLQDNLTIHGTRCIITKEFYSDDTSSSSCTNLKRKQIKRLKVSNSADIDFLALYGCAPTSIQLFKRWVTMTELHWIRRIVMKDSLKL